jgi:hypothetical protein
VTKLAQIVFMSDTPTQRYVPGAPPPVPATKSSKKKKKPAKGSRSEDSPALSSVAIPDSTSAALTDKTPDADVKDGPVVDSLPADPHSTNGLTSGQPAYDEAKHSRIVDFFQKRIKSTNKKIARIQGYATLDDEKLNDDQRRLLKSLPSLEAIVKELEEVKKAVEVCVSQSLILPALILLSPEP